MQPRSGEFYIVRLAAIKKFANMGLSGREISFAVEIETGIRVDPHDVARLVFAARKRGTLRWLTKEEKKDIAKTTANPWYHTDEVIRKDVEAIISNITALQREGKPLPNDRLALVEFRPSKKNPLLREEEEGVLVGNKRVFSDGRHLPTFKGLHVTERQRQGLIERNKLPRPREQVIKQSTVWPKVKPLRERLGLPGEIAEITGFTKQQVRTAISWNRFRPEWNRIPPLTSEQVAELMSKSGKTKKPRNPEDRELPTQDEKNSLEFARIVFDSGWITEDLKDWRKLNFLYNESKRDLPESFAKRLRLEVFLRAQLNADNGNKELMNKYVEYGLEIDENWFNELAAEEEFITRIVRGKEDRDRLFLDLFARVRREFARTGDIRSLNNSELTSIMKQDPTIKTRLAPEMAKIVQATPGIKKETSAICPPNGEMSMADIMGWDSR